MKKSSRLRRFLWLWFLMFVSYWVIRNGYNLLAFGLIDLRKTAFIELLVIPLGQSVLFWIFYRPARTGGQKNGPP